MFYLYNTFSPGIWDLVRALYRKGDRFPPSCDWGLAAISQDGTILAHIAMVQDDHEDHVHMLVTEPELNLAREEKELLDVLLALYRFVHCVSVATGLDVQCQVSGRLAQKAASMVEFLPDPTSSEGRWAADSGLAVMGDGAAGAAGQSKEKESSAKPAASSEQSSSTQKRCESNVMPGWQSCVNPRAVSSTGSGESIY